MSEPARDPDAPTPENDDVVPWLVRLRARGGHTYADHGRGLPAKEAEAGLKLQAPPGLLRPRTRGDCEPCATCQAAADAAERGERRRERGPLACGHELETILNHCRPCPWLSCERHLYLSVERSGSVHVAQPAREPWEIRDTCLQDVADGDDRTLVRVGTAMGITRERARQMLVSAGYRGKALADDPEAMSPDERAAQWDAMDEV